MSAFHPKQTFALGAACSTTLDPRPLVYDTTFMCTFRILPPKRERWSSGVSLSRHRHREGYVTIVLSGEYDEAGDYGRKRAVAGDVMFHAPFDAHANTMRARTTELLSIPLPLWFRPKQPHARLNDPDAVVIAAEGDPVEALQMISEMIQPQNQTTGDWPDNLARAIIAGDVTSLRAWAHDNELNPASLSRGFCRIYGTAPCRYRLELRSKHAWKRIVDTDQPLSTIAHHMGFSDQAHMSRCIRDLTGHSPGQWRRLKSFKTPTA